ncbi:DUF4942 domain-containing protein [Serratia proteamaculans]|uniref:DUF4942 domain-containing protein n=1 Tax=Serratia proteamaculans TaxID=28151 RepID=A0A5Q2VBW2_SERPR|nr:DUF4942 domain-containing protein [Serratia proteamaculans]
MKESYQRLARAIEDEMFAMKYFQKGTVHITVKRHDLVHKLNEIVAKHYPNMLGR